MNQVYGTIEKRKGKKLKPTTNKRTKNSQQTTFHTLDKIYNNDINLILSSYNSTRRHGIQRMIKKNISGMTCFLRSNLILKH